MTSNIKLLLFDGNRYGGLPKRFTRQIPRMISIRGIWIYFHIVKIIEIKGKLKTP